MIGISIASHRFVAMRTDEYGDLEADTKNVEAAQWPTDPSVERESPRWVFRHQRHCGSIPDAAEFRVLDEAGQSGLEPCRDGSII